MSYYANHSAIVVAYRFYPRNELDATKYSLLQWIFFFRRRVSYSKPRKKILCTAYFSAERNYLTSSEIDIKAHKTSAMLVYPGCLFIFFQMWFRNRRQRWKKEKKANTVDELTTQENEPSLSPRHVRNFYYANRASSSSVPDSLPVLLKCDREVLEPRDITPDKELSNSRRLTSNDKFARFVKTGQRTNDKFARFVRQD